MDERQHLWLHMLIARSRRCIFATELLHTQRSHKQYSGKGMDGFVTLRKYKSGLPWASIVCDTNALGTAIIFIAPLLVVVVLVQILLLLVPLFSSANGWL